MKNLLIETTVHLFFFQIRPCIHYEETVLTLKNFKLHFYWRITAVISLIIEVKMFMFLSSIGITIDMNYFILSFLLEFLR